MESCFNYQTIDVSPNGALILAVNEKGQAQLISTVSYAVVRTHKFQSDVISVKFSPNGKFFAVVRPGIGEWKALLLKNNQNLIDNPFQC